MIKYLKNLLITFLVAVSMGFVLLCFSFLLPVDIIKNNIKESLYSFEAGSRPNLIGSLANTRLDNYTDALMLQNAMYDGDESLIDRTMNIYRKSLVAYPLPVDSIKHYFETDDYVKINYPRYWHGYLTILKPMLLFFNYDQIKIINVFLQMILVFSILYLFFKQKKESLGLAYFLSLLCIYPNVVGLSLQFSSMFYIANIGVLLILLKNNVFSKDYNYLYLFLLLGIATSYFDFLTYPLVSIGLPLITYLLLNYDAAFVTNIKTIILATFTWGFGYFGMWFSKWAIASLFLKKNIIADGIKQAIFRTQGEGEHIYSKIETILLNYNYIKFMFVLGLIFLTIYIAFKVRKKELFFNKKSMLKFLPIFLLSLIPFVWYFFVTNHSYTHAWFTYRNLFVFAYGIYAYIMCLFKTIDFSYS